MKEVEINEFVVKVKISDTRQPEDTFKDEARRYFQDLNDMNGKDIELCELIDSTNRVTFIRGIAGMGKSVLTKQLAYLWANDKIYTTFKVCILVECRAINNFALKEGAFLSKHELFSNFLKSNFNYDFGFEEFALFIIDGLDELIDVKDRDSIILQLLNIHNSKYAKAKIILTGRPHVEASLDKTCVEMGGIRKVEIQGLSDEHVDNYVNKFATCEKDLQYLKKTIEASPKHLPLVSVPQFLNSFCCVAILFEGEIIRNSTELYCWILYLLLKQHVEKEGSSRNLCSKIFKDYSNELVMLSDICHELLNGNTIIFEGSIESRFHMGGKGKEFLKSLFVDVSDNLVEKHQFQHLTLMEFLSALHICGKKNRLEIIDNCLKTGLREVVLFACQLIVGCKYKGIIACMMVNGEELKAINIQQFLLSILKFVSQCFNPMQKDQFFQLSIDIIMCFINERVTNREFITSTVRKLNCEMNRLYPVSMRKVKETCEHLIREFKFTEKDLKKTFENVRVDKVVNGDVKTLAFAKYLQNFNDIELRGMKSNVYFIRNKINEIARCKKVDIVWCELVDDETFSIGKENYKFESLLIQKCKLNKASFINICIWAIASSVKELHLLYIDNIEHSWWECLTNAILLEKNNGTLALRKLNIHACTRGMRQEMKMQVR